MSGLTGIWNLDAEPVSRELLGAMSTQLAHRGPDGENVLLAGAAGFAYQSLRITPESLHEPQPAQHASGSILLWDGRLDNREELRSLLPGQTERDAPDTALVLAAFDRFQGDFLQHLNGDFTLALFDPRSQKLFLARDIMGSCTLHYCQAGTSFLFASEIKALLSHPKVKTEPDDRRVAEWLYRIPDYSDISSTFFKNVFTVPPGHCLTVTTGGNSLSKFWDFDTSARLRLRDHREYVEAYRECFQRAVTRRLRTAFPAAIFVSGGLDSSSIYSVAHHARQKRLVNTPLLGIAIAGTHPSADETFYQKVMETAHAEPLITLRCAMAGATADGIDKPAWHCEGPYLQSDIWHQAAKTAVTKGARIILSGYFGDHILLNPQYILDLLARGRFLAAMRHTRQFFDWWEGYPTQESVAELYGLLRGYLVPEKIRPVYHRARARLVPRTAASTSERFPWYSERLAFWARDLLLNHKPITVPGASAHAKILYHQIWSRISNLRFELNAKSEARFPIQTAQPFRDRDLVKLLMSIPGEIVYKTGSRGLHRDAMVGTLPEAVRTRRTKTTYTHPTTLGAISDLEQFRTRVETGTAGRLGYLVGQPPLGRGLDQLTDDLHRVTGAWLPATTSDLLGLEGWLSSYFNEP